MQRSVLLRFAGALALLTAAGHTLGILWPLPAELTQAHATLALMRTTWVPMPVGPARSFMELLDGNNLCTSLLLLLCAVLLFGVARASGSAVNRVIVSTALALLGGALICTLYFFVVPAVLTSVAAALALYAVTKAPQAA